jgi:serine/threonine protein kinase/molecular chaperone DnaK (HSP70)
MLTLNLRLPLSNSPDEPELIGDPAGQAMRRLADSSKESGSDDASSWADRLEASHADSMGDLTRDQTHSEVGFEVESFHRSIPEIVGVYNVGRPIGRGGMGEVFLAEHRSMGRKVALKILPTRWLDRVESVNRFYEEVRAASRLMHPNIVTAFDAGEADGIHYMAMEYVDGRTLSQWVNDQGPMAIGDAASAIRQAAFALHHAHAAGIVHRDVKPGNLMRAHDGTIKLLDLGLARFSAEWYPSPRGVKPRELDLPDDDNSHNSASTEAKNRPLLGTLSFISPEQLEDANSADSRSDQYSLGATLFYLLMGHPPFTGDLVEQVYGHRHGEVPDLMTLRNDVDLKLADIVRRMLAKDPAERYGSMDEVARAMAPYDNDRSTPAWVLDFARRETGEDHTTVGGESTRRGLLSVIGIELGMTHAATAITQSDGTMLAGWPGMSTQGPRPLCRIAVAEKTDRDTGQSTILFGDSAYERRERHPQRVAHCQMMYFGRDDMMRRIGGRMCPPEVTMGLCMRHLLGNTLTQVTAPGAPDGDSSSTTALGTSWKRHERWPDAVAITVPSSYDQLHRRAIYQSAQLAGLPAVRLIERSIAVTRFAMTSPHCSSFEGTPLPPIDSQSSAPILYVGLTGQSLDISILQVYGGQIRQIATAGHWGHSTMAWSRRLVEMISSRLPCAPKRIQGLPANRQELIHVTRIQMAGERAMNQLLLMPETRVEIAHQGHIDSVELTRDEWLTECEDLLLSIEESIRLVCQRAGVLPSDLKHCLAMGPLLRLPAIRDRVLTKGAPNAAIAFYDQVDAAHGAAACVASELPGQLCSEPPAKGVAGHSIGFVVADRDGKRRILPIIPRGTPTPARTNRQLNGTARDNRMTLSLVESSGKNGENWQTLGRHTIEVAPDEVNPMRRLGFELDINGLLSVHLERPDLGRTVMLPSLPTSSMDEMQWQDWREWIEATL